MTQWQLGDAKNRFSEVVRRAEREGPQLVTRHGKEAVVIVSAEEYRRLADPGDLVGFLECSPLAEALIAGELDPERPRELGREVELG